MSVRANIWRVLLTAGCLFVPCSFAHADDTNPPVIATAPATISTPATNPAPAAAPQPTDPERFFSQYAKAADLVRQNARPEASVIMDLLWRNLSTSPWFEIALLKHAELSEMSNAQVAREDYEVLRQRVENAPYFQGNAERAAVFRTALLGAVGRGM